MNQISPAEPQFSVARSKYGHKPYTAEKHTGSFPDIAVKAANDNAQIGTVGRNLELRLEYPSLMNVAVLTADACKYNANGTIELVRYEHSEILRQILRWINGDSTSVQLGWNMKSLILGEKTIRFDAPIDLNKSLDEHDGHFSSEKDLMGLLEKYQIDASKPLYGQIAIIEGALNLDNARLIEGIKEALIDYDPAKKLPEQINGMVLTKELRESFVDHDLTKWISRSNEVGHYLVGRKLWEDYINEVYRIMPKPERGGLKTGTGFYLNRNPTYSRAALLRPLFIGDVTSWSTFNGLYGYKPMFREKTDIGGKAATAWPDERMNFILTKDLAERESRSLFARIFKRKPNNH